MAEGNPPGLETNSQAAAVQIHLEKLTETERKLFNEKWKNFGVAQILNEDQKLDDEHSKRRIRRWVMSFVDFVQQIDVYLKIVDKVVGAFPDAVAIVWGALTFLIEVGTLKVIKIASTTPGAHSH